MNTVVYIARHSQPFRNLIGDYKANEYEQIRNEKNFLSVEGEKLAKEMSQRFELKNIDALYSSHYVRAMSTAKYIAENNNIVLNVDERLGERKFGVKSMSELPKSFFENQFKNWNYKLNNGESANDVFKRTSDVMQEILNKNKNKKVAIISHGTAISILLSKWCDVKLNDVTKLVEIYFEDKLVFDGNWKCPELFKLEFDDNNNLILIQNIKQ